MKKPIIIGIVVLAAIVVFVFVRATIITIL